MSPGSIIQGYLELTDGLFPPEWFDRHRGGKHPVWARRTACLKFLEQGGQIRIPEDEALLPTLGEALIDGSSWVAVSKGGPGRFVLGDLSEFGGENKRRMLVSRVTDPEQYLDVLAETTVAAWHLARGHHVRGLEEPGMPDMRVEIPGQSLPAYIECKRLRSLRVERLLKEVRATAHQLGNVTEPFMGVASLQLARPRLKRSRDLRRIPPWVSRLANEVRRMFLRRKSSLGLAVLTWDDYIIAQDGSGLAQIELRRNGIQVPHPDFPWASASPPLPLYQGTGATFLLKRTDAGGHSNGD